MKIRVMFCVWAIGLVAALLVSACGGTATLPPPAPSPTAAPPQPTVPPRVPTATPQPANMPNPASAFCAQQGGKLDIRKDAKGGEYGVCVFADKSECEEWAFMRGECKPGQPSGPIGMTNPASDYCKQHGNVWALRKDASGHEYGVCILPDGSECEEWAFFRGDCPPQSPQPTAAPQRITFSAGGAAAAVQGNVAAVAVDRWLIRVNAGQTMFAQLNPPNSQAILVIWGADGTVLISDHAGATSWSGPIPKTQDYYIDVRNDSQTKVGYTLNVTVPPLPAPTPAPYPNVKRIVFGPGAITAAEQGQVDTGGLNRYVIKVTAGQMMSVYARRDAMGAGPVALVIWGADGTVLLSDHAGADAWSGPIPATQDYYIDVKSAGAWGAVYTLQVTVPPR